METSMIYLIIALVVAATLAIVGYIVAGEIGMIALAVIVLTGFATLPATPIVPIWVVVLIIIVSLLIILAKVFSPFRPVGGEN